MYLKTHCQWTKITHKLQLPQGAAVQFLKSQQMLQRKAFHDYSQDWTTMYEEFQKNLLAYLEMMELK